LKWKSLYTPLFIHVFTSIPKIGSPHSHNGHWLRRLYWDPRFDAYARSLFKKWPPLSPIPRNDSGPANILTFLSAFFLIAVAHLNRTLNLFLNIYVSVLASFHPPHDPASFPHCGARSCVSALTSQQHRIVDQVLSRTLQQLHHAGPGFCFSGTILFHGNIRGFHCILQGLKEPLQLFIWVEIMSNIYSNDIISLGLYYFLSLAIIPESLEPIEHSSINWWNIRRKFWRGHYRCFKYTKNQTYLRQRAINNEQFQQLSFTASLIILAIVKASP